MLYLLSILENLKDVIFVLSFVLIPFGVWVYFIIHGDERKTYFPQKLQVHNKLLKKVFILWLFLIGLFIIIPSEYNLYQMFGMIEHYQPTK